MPVPRVSVPKAGSWREKNAERLWEIATQQQVGASVHAAVG
jgi:hypothetical protein